MYVCSANAFNINRTPGFTAIYEAGESPGSGYYSYRKFVRFRLIGIRAPAANSEDSIDTIDECKKLI